MRGNDLCLLMDRGWPGLSRWALISVCLKVGVLPYELALSLEVLMVRDEKWTKKFAYARISKGRKGMRSSGDWKN
jgi:hypothetical protein